MTRDFFPSYWRNSLIGWLGGHNKAHFKLSPGQHQQGAVRSHVRNSPSLLSCLPFLAIYLYNASLFYILNGKMPINDFFKESFLACLDEKASRLVQQGKSAARFSSDLQHDLLVYFSQQEFFKLPTAENIHDMITEISVYRGYSQPFFILSGMKNSSCQGLFAMQSE